MTDLAEREPVALEVHVLDARVGAGDDDALSPPQLGAIVAQAGGVSAQCFGDRANPVELRAGTQWRRQGRMASREKRTRPLPVAIQM
jgi:hypothetical protein